MLDCQNSEFLHAIVKANAAGNEEDRLPEDEILSQMKYKRPK